MDVRLIVAHDKNRVIGRDGDMPWRLRDDLRFFKETTTDHVVIMGRKTFETIGRPLPHRTNVVITRDPNFQRAGVVVVPSPEAALAWARERAGARPPGTETRAPSGARPPGSETRAPVFVIGGGQIYEALLPAADVVYVTLVRAELEGDTYFPKLGPEWTWIELWRHPADEHNDHAFVVYRVERRRSQGRS